MQDDETDMQVEASVMQEEQAPSRNSRKRPLGGVENLSLGGASLQGLSLEAIFHPKFENENREELDIRQQMKERVLSGNGYLEVSLKHSGSLLLWSGRQRYYSKNSMENQFTYVGEILLRQHFYRAWHKSQSTLDETAYRVCSDYIEDHRLTLAFEVVTAGLGDHGEAPQRDFLILTAVADRQSERFFSMEELLELAHRFRLPHNDSWIMSSSLAVDRLFHLYDTTRETGLAASTIAALHQAADAHVSSMYPHTVFQGDILEGIVIRYVPYPCQSGDRHVQHQQQVMQRLAAVSNEILADIPPETPPSFILAQSQANAEKPVLVSDIRTILAEAKATGETSSVMTPLLNILSESDGGNRRFVERSNKLSDSFPEDVRDLLLREDSNKETKRICKTIETLVSLRKQVEYRVVKETMGESFRWLCTVHVRFDAAHQKFRNQMKPGDMPLFRGYCIELGSAGTKSYNKTVHTSPVSSQEISGESDLMLKMKFLPYMVRTFACRNGLKVIAQKGPAAFVDFTMDLMTRWGISMESMKKWQPFFRAWAIYAQANFDGVTNEHTTVALPKLSEMFYLDHMNHFTQLYESGRFAEHATLTNPFRGLVVIVALTPQISDSVADYFADALGGLRRCPGQTQISGGELTMACTPQGRGIVCNITPSSGVKHIRKHLKNHHDHIFVVLFGCDDERINVRITTQDQKKTKGMVGAWRRTKCHLVIELPESSLFDPEDALEMPLLRPSDEFRIELGRLQQEASTSTPLPDTRRGLLVFFPGIPGSGKSTLTSKTAVPKIGSVHEDESESCNDHGRLRDVTVLVGDEVKKKFWPFVAEEALRNPSTICIADKNAPPSSWTIVGQTCSKSFGIAIPVLPDENALRTTCVRGVGLVSEALQNDKEHHYPFSLHYLAVCMARVLNRSADSHCGKLDSATADACMIVVKFFSLYRKISADELIDSIQDRIQASGGVIGSTIRVPFFRDGTLPDLPEDLEDALQNALQIQFGFDLAGNKKSQERDERVEGMERRLRQSLETHKDFLFSLTTEEAVSRKCFLDQLPERIVELGRTNPTPDNQTDLPMSGFISIASVDVKVEDVHSILKLCCDEHPCITGFLEMATENDETASAGDRFSGKCFVTDTHVTMAHCSRMPQDTMRQCFGALVGSGIRVTVTGILWTDQVAAFAVDVGSYTDDMLKEPVPSPQNTFPHITVWHREGVMAVESNELPDLVLNGTANRVDFMKNKVIRGVVSLWGKERG